MEQIINIAELDAGVRAAFSEREWKIADEQQWGASKPKFETHSIERALTIDGVLIGYIKGSTELGVAHIDSLIVGSEFQGRGHAKKLVRDFEAEALRLGCHKVLLETGATWPARHVYERLGYTLVATLKNHFNHQDFLLFEKSLES
jgi:ribosomal protein S18 acetylase RimI-like enzyme